MHLFSSASPPGAVASSGWPRLSQTRRHGPPEMSSRLRGVRFIASVSYFLLSYVIFRPHPPLPYSLGYFLLSYVIFPPPPSSIPFCFFVFHSCIRWGQPGKYVSRKRRRERKIIMISCTRESSSSDGRLCFAVAFSSVTAGFGVLPPPTCGGLSASESGDRGFVHKCTEKKNESQTTPAYKKTRK